MGYRHISNNLKEAAIQLKNHGTDTNYEIKQITGMSTCTLGRAIQCKQMMGSVTKDQAVGHGHPQSLLRQDCDYLLYLACYNLTLFLDRYSLCLEQFCALSISLVTIHWSFEQAGLNVKHVQKLAKGHDPFLHAIFRHHIGQYPTLYLIFIDEVSKDNHTYT